MGECHLYQKLLFLYFWCEKTLNKIVMKIAVIAKDERDFRAYLAEIHSNKQASEIFERVIRTRDIVGKDWSAVIVTRSAWENRDNRGLVDEVIMRINYNK